LVLQMPGLFRDWATLDKVRAVLAPEFQKAFAEAGFFISKIGDLGIAHSMSKGYSVGSPADLRGRHPYMWRDDPVAPVLLQIIGGITAVPLSVPEVLPALNTAAIDSIVAPPLAAEQLQWASRLDHMTEDVAGAGIGAMVISSKKLDALPADVRAVLEDTGKVTSAALDGRIRNEDNAAFLRLKGKMTVNKLTDAQTKEWTQVFKKTHARLAQGIFTKEMVERVQKLAGYDPKD
jgi:TRAP-type C4-dicarboxylate transport system substrate-binding protein